MRLLSGYGRPSQPIYLAAFILALVAVAPAAAQEMTAVDPDPDMPVKDGFDTGRAIFWSKPNFIPLRDPDWQPLKGALRSGAIAEQTPVVIFEAGGETLALVSSQMAYHHVAQGDVNGEAWMVSF
jgi:hypothetical protein